MLQVTGELVEAQSEFREVGLGEVIFWLPRSVSAALPEEHDKCLGEGDSLLERVKLWRVLYSAKSSASRIHQVPNAFYGSQCCSVWD